MRAFSRLTLRTTAFCSVLWLSGCECGSSGTTLVPDGAFPDAGARDGGPVPGLDAARPDAGFDAAVDAEAADASAVDAAAIDAGGIDAAGIDAAGLDAAAPDAGLSIYEILNGVTSADGLVLRMGAPSNWGGVDVPGPLPGGEIVPSEVRDAPSGVGYRFEWTANGQVYSNVIGVSADLRPYVGPDTALTMRVRVDEYTTPTDPEQKVILAAHCIFPCLGEVDLTTTMATIDDGDWHTIAVPISCLVTGGLDLTQVNTPWLFYNDVVGLEISVDQVRWQPSPGRTCTDIVVDP